MTNSGLYLSAIGVNLEENSGPKKGVREMCNTLETAVGCGVNHFDLAPHYGDSRGAVEEIFGRALQRFSNLREDLVISARAGLGTQSGLMPGFGSRKCLMTSLDSTLSRTKLECVDVFYAHRYDAFTPIEETASALDSIARQGKALYVGLSGYAPAMVRRVAAILRDLGTPLSVCRVTYSMLHRWPEDGLLDVLADERIGCVADGTLDVTFGPYPDCSRKEVERLQTRLSRISLRRGQSSRQCALSWVLRQPSVASALVALPDSDDLLEYCAAVHKTSFAEEELVSVDGCFPEVHRS
ncbi:aldo/keto reductase [Streptomyces stramineus]|uniref:L-glyceraldehyde 3-phosphate reductase n=1 Tax=Streptomyces stramineus TaxID=173861 RepID=A0ABN1BHY0_9ACTN